MSTLLFTTVLVSMPALALETDQFYAWGKPIEDSSDYLNAWVRLTIQSALDSNSADAPESCESAIKLVQSDLQHSIYQPIELWIISSDLVDRVPRGLEATFDYRSRYLLSKTFTFDYARLIQPSPTLEVNGIRFGSDKLAHFFSEGWWYYRHWRKNRKNLTPEEMQRRLFEFGVGLEQSIQGVKVTGVFSPADLESNYQGFLFYRQLCQDNGPLLYRRDGRWHFSERFDISDYISPKWDESWNPNIYTARRWDGVRSTMAGYCHELDNSWVIQQREYYAKLDRPTPTMTFIRDLVASGELPDPETFDITAVCQ